MIQALAIERSDPRLGVAVGDRGFVGRLDDVDARGPELVVDGFRFRTRQEAKLEVFNFIDGYYNPRRLHSTLGYQSPDEFEQNHNPEPMMIAA